MKGQEEKGRPRFGWLDGALAVRELGFQETKQLARERKVYRELARAYLF